MTFLRIELNAADTLSVAERRMLGLPGRLRALPSFMANTLAPMRDAMLRRHWETKGASSGVPWAPWAASTLRERLRKGNAASGILRDTDHLFGEVFKPFTADQVTSVPGGFRLGLAIHDRTAVFHQLGTRFMPMRQIFPLPVPAKFTDDVRTALRTFLVTGDTAE